MDVVTNQEMSTHHQHTGVKKKQSLLSEVLVNGLMKNINEKVGAKLDDEAQSELAGIVSQKVKEGGIIHHVVPHAAAHLETGVSFDDSPFSDHIQGNATKNRATLPQNRRLPSSRSQSKIEMEQPTETIDSLEEDFENLLKDEDIDVEDDDILEDLVSDKPRAESVKKQRLSYLDDFEALLKESSEAAEESCDSGVIQDCDIDADFDALIEEENVDIEDEASKETETSNETVDADFDALIDENELVDEEVVSDEDEEIIDDDPVSVHEINQKTEATTQDVVDHGVVDKNKPESQVTDDHQNVEDQNEFGSSQQIMKDHGDEQIVKDLKDEQIAEDHNNDEKQIVVSESVVGQETVEEEAGSEETGTNVLDTGMQAGDNKTEHEEVNENVTDKADMKHGSGSIIEETDSSEKEEECIDDVDNICVEDAVDADSVGGVGTSHDDLGQDDDETEGRFPHVQSDSDEIESCSNNNLGDSSYKNDLKPIEVFHTGFSSDDDDDEEEIVISDSGKIVIVPTMEIPDKESLDLEILQDSREAELLIQLKHLNARVEAQDTLLAELKEENTVLKIQNQNLVESLNKVTNNNSKPSLFRKPSKEFQSLDAQDLDDSTDKKKLFLLEQELEDQKEVNKQLKAYVGDVLINIIVQNPEILEKKSPQ